jgi:prepilin-type N-terminal cleavage/methylation domain-containing protein
MNQKIKLGFSMFELLVVMVIISLMIAATSQGSRIIAKSRLLAAQSITKSSPIPRIKNLLVWYETTMEGSFISSEAAQGPISTWYNLNPALNGTNTANNAAAGNAPTYTENQINNLPALVFDGASNYLTFDGTAIANSDYSVVVVEQRLSSQSNNYYISGNGTATLNYNLFVGYELENKSAFGQTSNGYDTSVSDFSSTSIVNRIHIFRFNPSVGKNYYINGANQTLTEISGGTPSQTTGLVSNNNAQIGRHRSGYYYAGAIGEIAIFNKYINDDERKDIEQYLGKKWGITI